MLAGNSTTVAAPRRLFVQWLECCSFFQETVEDIDKDKDGKISLEEYIGTSTSIFLFICLQLIIYNRHIIVKMIEGNERISCLNQHLYTILTVLREFLYKCALCFRLLD